MFTIYWLSGKREIVNGTDIADAFTKAGYSNGAINSVDFFCKGDNNEYIWKNNKWEQKPLDL